MDRLYFAECCRPFLVCTEGIQLFRTQHLNQERKKRQGTVICECVVMCHVFHFMFVCLFSDICVFVCVSLGTVWV